jgi:hypothetical protein
LQHKTDKEEPIVSLVRGRWWGVHRQSLGFPFQEGITEMKSNQKHLRKLYIEDLPDPYRVKSRFLVHLRPAGMRRNEFIFIIKCSNGTIYLQSRPFKGDDADSVKNAIIEEYDELNALEFKPISYIVKIKKKDGKKDNKDVPGLALRKTLNLHIEKK